MRNDRDLGHASSRGYLQRLDARIKLFLAVVYVVVVVAVPVGEWLPIGGLALGLAFLSGISGVPAGRFLGRWAGFLMLFGFLAVVVASGMPERSRFGLPVLALWIGAKNSLAFLMMVLLAETTSWPSLVKAMRMLGMPRALVATLQFMERYIHVLGEELARMTTARRARSFGRGGISWSSRTGMIAMLFLRSFERAERVHLAMLARGWDGTMRTLEDRETAPSSVLSPPREARRRGAAARS